jgi:aldose 1-epimerase
VYDQEAVFFSSYYLPSNSALLATGEIRSVHGTPFDFTTEKPIGRDISAAGGYDACFVIARPEGGLAPACCIRDPQSGRVMEVSSTMPGVHFYTGNYLDGRAGAGGKRYERHGAFCIETEHFPDCVNIGHFPSCILRPGQTYHHLTIYRLSA